MNNFQFDYEDINPLNYKGKSGLNDDLDEILNNTINTTIDWKIRENALKKLGQICLGDQGNSETFIKIFNGQLCNNLGIQMADLRSSVMKEACRITSLCAKELGILIEQGVIYLLTQSSQINFLSSTIKSILFLSLLSISYSPSDFLFLNNHKHLFFFEYFHQILLLFGILIEILKFSGSDSVFLCEILI